jgi:hypothetical protein
MSGGHEGGGGGLTSWPNFRPHTHFRVNFSRTGKESIKVSKLCLHNKNKNKSLKNTGTGIFYFNTVSSTHNNYHLK